MESKVLNDALRHLISKTDSSPFDRWPNADKEQISSHRHRIALRDLSEGRLFHFESQGNLQLFFQIQELRWDTEHFGFKCGVLKNFYVDDDLSFFETETICNQIRPVLYQYLQESGFTFLMADICSSSKNGNSFIQLLGFDFIVNWIDGFSLPRKIEIAPELSVGPLKSEEVDAVCQIASNYYFRGGRFFSDRRFPEEKIRQMYSAIIKNSFEKKENVLAVREKGAPIGIFVSKTVTKYGEFGDLRVAHLRFLVLDPSFRGGNIGYNLFQGTLDYLHDQCDLIVTGLESSNLVSLNLHSKLGFKFNYSHNAYHLWTKAIR